MKKKDYKKKLRATERKPLKGTNSFACIPAALSLQALSTEIIMVL